MNRPALLGVLLLAMAFASPAHADHFSIGLNLGYPGISIGGYYGGHHVSVPFSVSVPFYSYSYASPYVVESPIVVAPRTYIPYSYYGGYYGYSYPYSYYPYRYDNYYPYSYYNYYPYTSYPRYYGDYGYSYRYHDGRYWNDRRHDRDGDHRHYRRGDGDRDHGDRDGRRGDDRSYRDNRGDRRFDSRDGRFDGRGDRSSIRSSDRFSGRRMISPQQFDSRIRARNPNPSLFASRGNEVGPSLTTRARQVGPSLFNTDSRNMNLSRSRAMDGSIGRAAAFSQRGNFRANGRGGHEAIAGGRGGYTLSLIHI